MPLSPARAHPQSRALTARRGRFEMDKFVHPAKFLRLLSEPRTRVRLDPLSTGLTDRPVVAPT
jgi:hypothetical protein